MTRLIYCDYCGQRNNIDTLCCEFCGAPVIMTELKVRESWKTSEPFPNIMAAASTGVMDWTMAPNICSTSLVEGELYREGGRLSFMQDYDIGDPRDTQRRIDELEKRMERGSFRAEWSESIEDRAPAPDPPKRGWREWLGIGDRR